MTLRVGAAGGGRTKVGEDLAVTLGLGGEQTEGRGGSTGDAGRRLQKSTGETRGLRRGDGTRRWQGALTQHLPRAISPNTPASNKRCLPGSPVCRAAN